MNDFDLRKQAYAARNVLIDEIKRATWTRSEYSIPDADHELLPTCRKCVFRRYFISSKERYEADNNDPIRPSENMVDIEENVLDENEEPEVPEIPSWYKSAIGDAEEDSLDEEINLASQRLPSSMGFTFFVKGECTQIHFELSFGTYRKTRLEDCMVPFKPEYDDYEIPTPFSQYVEFDKDRALLRLKAPLKKQDVFKAYESNNFGDYVLKERLISLCNQLGRSGYIRVPHKTKVIVNFSDSDYVDNIDKIDGTTAKITALRRKMGDRGYAITIMMVNKPL